MEPLMNIVVPKLIRKIQNNNGNVGSGLSCERTTTPTKDLVNKTDKDLGQKPEELEEHAK